jgi:hypothetical protein
MQPESLHPVIGAVTVILLALAFFGALAASGVL